MAQTVAQHAVATFVDPQNGQSPISATQVLTNDNALRTGYVAHDADPGIHLQSSALASRLSAGSAGRKWLTADASSYRLFFDDGSAWQELTYLRTDANGSVTGNLTVTGAVTGGSFVGPLTGNASTATALQTARAINGVNFDGTAAITVTAAAGTLSGATLAAGVTASSLTSVGTLTSLTVSGSVSLSPAGSVVTISPSGAGGLTINPSNGTIDNVVIGNSTPVAGTFTTLVANTSLSAFGLVLTVASAAPTAGLRVPHGTAPAAPVDGDVWTTTAGLFVRINGVTVGPLS